MKPSLRSMSATERNELQLRSFSAVVFGEPQTAPVRDLYLVQHMVFPDGDVVAMGTLAWMPPVCPVVRHPDGVPLPGPCPEGILSPQADHPIDLIGYDEFHHEAFGNAVTRDGTFGRSEGHRCVVAVRNARLIGWASGHNANSSLLIAATNSDGFDVGASSFLPPLKTRVPCIECVWVAKDHRGTGLGAELIRALSATWGLTPDRVAYGLPFSRAGFHLVRATVGPQFLCAAQSISALRLTAQNASRLARPDARIEVPAIPPELVAEGEKLADECFDFSSAFSCPIERPKPKREASRHRPRSQPQPQPRPRTRNLFRQRAARRLATN